MLIYIIALVSTIIDWYFSMDYRKFSDEEVFEYLSDVTARYTRLLHKGFPAEEFNECRNQLELLIKEASLRIDFKRRNSILDPSKNRNR